jgi:hypothetical protein
MSESDKLWHASFKPSFTPMNELIYKSNNDGEAEAGWVTERLAQSQGRSIALTSLQHQAESVRVDFILLSFLAYSPRYRQSWTPRH